MTCENNSFRTVLDGPSLLYSFFLAGSLFEDEGSELLVFPLEPLLENVLAWLLMSTFLRLVLECLAV